MLCIVFLLNPCGLSSRVSKLFVKVFLRNYMEVS